ncbi:HSFY1 protein, partial [Burhinus bistriatus]|nr:HSFY1 protein [Burhinus bistriatus]
TFPKKPWRIVQSHWFQSIWWVNDGISVAIDEEPFKKNVIARREPHSFFVTDIMKSFLHQFHLYTFTKVQRGSKTSDLLDEFLAEAAAAAFADSKLLFYNPSFKRDDPHLLERCKQR